MSAGRSDAAPSGLPLQGSESRAEIPERDRWSVASALLVLAGFAALALRFWFLIGSLAVSVPYWDQWDFLDGLFRGLGWFDLFLWQHGPHREGLAGVVYSILFPLTDWSARAEALVAWSAIALAAALALRLKCALAGRLAPSDLFFPLAFFSLSSYELFLGAQNLAHGPLPVFLATLAAFLAPTLDDRRRLAALAGVGVLATFTGFGLALGPPLALLVGLELIRARPDRARRTDLIGALAVLACGWLAFFRNYLWLPASDCLDEGRSALGDGATFVGGMVGHAWGLLERGESDGLDLRIAGGLLLFAACAAAMIRAAIGIVREDEPRRRRWRAILLLTGFSLVFVLLSSAGRSCLGLDSALSSRYTIYSAPGMVGLLLWARGFAPRRRRAALFLLVLLLAAKEVRSLGDAELARQSHRQKLAWVDCYREFRDLARCDHDSGMAIFPESGRAHSRIEEKLRYLELHHLSLFSAAEDERARERAAAREAKLKRGQRGEHPRSKPGRHRKRARDHAAPDIPPPPTSP